MIDFKKFDNKQITQLIWGAALFVMGVAFFFRIPEVMDRIADVEQFESITPFIRIAFYIMGILLIGGGIKKVHGILYPKDSG